MHLAILHYHLNRGGVTQVIRNQLRALSAVAGSGSTDIERVAVLHGGRREAWPETIAWPGNRLDVQLVPVESLEYDDVRGVQTADPPALARDLQATFARLQVPPGETLLHAHNHAVGKNASLPGGLAEVARDGYRLLLQVHDFAEDFRPANYHHLTAALETRSPAEVAERLYPQADHVHYAVLNGRDHAILQHAFGDGQRVHLLPNPVEGPGSLPDRAASRRKIAAECSVPEDVRLVVYPVRGIRRKNVGEMLLWSAVLREKAVFAVTLRPIHPAESGPYDRWVSLAGELRLGCRFGTSEAGPLDYHDNLAASDLLLTTSVAEGFGMVFLEAPLCGRPLVGRDLPEITADFKRQGVRFGGLAHGVTLPSGAVDAAAALRSLADSYADVRRAYGLAVDAAQAVSHAEEAFAGRPLDFAMLTPGLQADLLRRVAREASLRDAIVEANPETFQLPDPNEEAVAADVTHNAALIEEHFGLQSSGRRLVDLYATVMASEAGPLTTVSGGEAILDRFLDIRRLHPVRLET